MKRRSKSHNNTVPQMPKPSNEDIIALTLTDTPLDNPAEMEAAAELFQALGAASSSWMRLEMHLDMLLLYINRSKHSDSLHKVDHPVAFGSKLKLLKKWFNQHPALKPFSGDFRGLAINILELSKFRNTFLHSILSSFNPVTKEAVWRSIQAAGEETHTVGMHVGSVLSGMRLEFGLARSPDNRKVSFQAARSIG